MSGAFDGFPDGLLFLKAGDYVVNLLFADLDGFGLDTQGTVIAEVDGRFKGNGSGE